MSLNVHPSHPNHAHQHNKDFMSGIIHYMKYAKHLKQRKRRETYTETIQRNMNMHIQKFPDLQALIEKAFEPVFERKILPSMRGLQFGGDAIRRSPAKIFNCSYIPIDDPYAFCETMYLLLCGCGVGYSVQDFHIDCLPPITTPGPKQRYVVEDSIEGWAYAVNALARAFFYGDNLPDFDFSQVRPAGSPISSGGKAPGPDPLRIALENVQTLLMRKLPGSRLYPIEANDIQCYLSDAVLAGGIRRSSFICLFSLHDQDMLTCKAGDFWRHSPQRSRANNSAVLYRDSITKPEFFKYMEMVRKNNTGEPGVFWSNSREFGTNPCGEAGLRPGSFCNTMEADASTIQGLDDMLRRAEAMSTIATMQASYTDFHLLRPLWRKQTEEDALLGISLTGLAGRDARELFLRQGAETIVQVNQRMANRIGINSAARTTMLKPAGTTSLILGTSSGIHTYHNDFYLRRITINNNEPIFAYLKQHVPELLEVNRYKPDTEHFLVVPQCAPPGAVLRKEESAIELLERVKYVYEEWVMPGHVRGENTHNVSATINVKDHEWDEITPWMWDNRHSYAGVALMPHDGGTYEQTPFEDCDEETFQRMSQFLKNIDLTQVTEHRDNTKLSETVACSGGVCELI